MTNSIALALAVLILALFALDATVLHWNLPLEVGRQVAALIDWVSFWQ